MGDFNANASRKQSFRHTRGEASFDEASNNNGVRLLTFIISENHIAKSTYLEHKYINKYTWITSNGNTLDQTDHALVERQRHTNKIDVRNLREVQGVIDHHKFTIKL